MSATKIITTPLQKFIEIIVPELLLNREGIELERLKADLMEARGIDAERSAQQLGYQTFRQFMESQAMREHVQVISAVNRLTVYKGKLSSAVADNAWLISYQQNAMRDESFELKRRAQKRQFQQEHRQQQFEGGHRNLGAPIQQHVPRFMHQPPLQQQQHQQNGGNLPHLPPPLSSFYGFFRQPPPPPLLLHARPGQQQQKQNGNGRMAVVSPNKQQKKVYNGGLELVTTSSSSTNVSADEKSKNGEEIAAMQLHFERKMDQMRSEFEKMLEDQARELREELKKPPIITLDDDELKVPKSEPIDADDEIMVVLPPSTEAEEMGPGRGGVGQFAADNEPTAAAGKQPQKQAADDSSAVVADGNTNNDIGIDVGGKAAEPEGRIMLSQQPAVLHQPQQQQPMADHNEANIEKKEKEADAAAPPNIVIINENQRVLRERKRRINYRV